MSAASFAARRCGGVVEMHRTYRSGEVTLDVLTPEEARDRIAKLEAMHHTHGGG